MAEPNAPVHREVKAAGGVLWRRLDGRLQVAVIHRPKYDDWSLPKGKLEPGEPAVLAALREVGEETGFSAVVGRTLGESRYRVLDSGRDVPKTVRWWAMRATDGAFSPTAEVDRLVWLELPQALSRVTAGRDAGPLAAFADGPGLCATVLLVRHASAGSHTDWPGPDEQRPLDDTGRLQAQALARVLPVYGPQRIVAAPAVRCGQTVAPLGAALGCVVELDDDLAELSAGRLAPSIRAVPDGETHVLCSQGGVIPEAVRDLAAGSAVELGDKPVAARKGSLWALTLAGGRLLDADYTARLC